MRVFVVFLCLPLLFFSCGSDAEPVGEVAAQLAGRWELVEARRDNVKTTTLDGLYLVFGPDGAFETNLLTDTPQRGAYTRSENELTITGVELPLTYEIVVLEGDILAVQSRIEGAYFSFLFQRAGGDAEQSAPPTD